MSAISIHKCVLTKVKGTNFMSRLNYLQISAEYFNKKSFEYVELKARKCNGSTKPSRTPYVTKKTKTVVGLRETNLVFP